MSTRRQLLLIVLLASACGGGGTDDVMTPTTEPVATTAAPESTESATPSPVPLAAPSPRGYHLMVAVDDGPGTLLLGGFSTPGPYDPSADAVWAHTSSGGWTELGLEEVSRFHSAAYDAGSGLVVLYDGAEGTAPTSTFDPSTGRLHEMSAGGPLYKHGAQMAYDAGSDRIVLFGGLHLSDGSLSDETWTYDVDTDTWTQMHPAVSPPGRNFHSMAYDPQTDRVILFGGYGERNFADTWAYDVDTGTWTELTPKRSPSARTYMAMVYDPVGKRIILFGGTTGIAEEPLGDTWAFDPAANTWTALSPESAPGPRGWHAMAYDAEARVIVLFGGGPTREEYTAETWIYDPRGNTWSQVA